MRTFDNKNASMPRSVWLASGGFPQQLSVGSEDIELGLRLRRKGVQIVYDPSIVAYHHERKTFAGFVDQHRRIAMSEALLALRAPGADSLREVYIKKIILHIQSAVRRELFYLTSFQITYFFMLPCLYIVLAVVRVWTYHMTTWTHQK